MSKLLLAVLLALSLASPAAAAVGEEGYGPILQEAYVEDLVQAGLRNGNMPSLRMFDVEGCLLERDAAYTLSLLLEAARADGVYLATEDCYRSFGTQAAAYERRCPVVEEEVTAPDPETGEERVVGVNRSRACTGPPIARAGRSNHGWGRAVDFSTGSRILSCRDAGFFWLQENAGRFGWVNPGWAHCGRPTREPWHWEWGGLHESLPLPFVPVPVYSGGDIQFR